MAEPQDGGANTQGAGNGVLQASVSVLIATYNRAQYLAECLDSVLGQTVRPAQIIVVNDGSTDNTAEVLKPYLDRIEYIEKKNGGKASALNLAMQRVRGDYVWIMDDDDAGLPDALETHLKVLENKPEVGFTWTTGFYAREGVQGGRLEAYERWPLPEAHDEGLFLRLLEGNVVAFHSAILCRTSCYRAVGQFNLELIRSQDYDMLLRLARRFRGRRLDQPTILYRIHSGARGSETTRFGVEEIGSKWRAYNRKILLRLRGELELREYLPAVMQHQPLGALEARRAYLQRMAAMASTGLVTEMLEDLRLAVSGHSSDSHLAPEERDFVRRSIEYLTQSELAVLRRTFRAGLLDTLPLGREVREEMARAFYERAVKGLNERHPKEILAVLRAGRKVHGLYGFLGAMRRARLHRKLVPVAQGAARKGHLSD